MVERGSAGFPPVQNIKTERYEQRMRKARTRKARRNGKAVYRYGSKAGHVAGPVALSLALAGGLIFSAPLTVGAASAEMAVPAAQTDTEAVSIAPYAGYAGARAATPLYSYPARAMAVSLTLNGTPVLTGACAEINGTIYVPVERFVNLFGSFTVSYTASPEQVTVTGTNLSVQVKVGDPYITVNGRILYTGAKVLSLRGWVFAPLSSLSTAMNAKLTVRQGWYQASLTSGNPAAVPSASQVYNSTDLYWLSRIISAEARGEPLEGQIAVGNVVLNRARSSEFPNTVKEVIFDTKYGVQFSPVSNGSIYNTPTDSAVMAAKICLEGYTLSDRALYFFNPAIATSSWIKRTRPYIMTIGNHAFYG